MSAEFLKTEKLINFAKLILLVTLLGSELTRAADSGPKANGPVDKSAPLGSTVENYVLRLQKVLKKHIYILDRDMVVFHYQRPDPNGWVPKSLVDVKNHLINSPANFYNTAMSEESMEGPGLYGAIDPIGSRMYGGKDDPQLYVLTIRKGAVILKLKRDPENLLLPEVERISTELGCNTKKESARIYASDVTVRFRNSGQPICREVIVKAYAQLGVQGIIYDYTAAYTLNGCRDTRGEAINIISPDIINDKSLAWYSHKGLVEGVPMGGMIQRLYWESLSNRDLRLLKDDEMAKDIPAQLRNFTISEAEYESWKQAHIYKCGSAWSLEKKPSDEDLLGAKISRTYRDREVEHLVWLVESAYAAKNLKSTNPPFSVSNMNQFEVLSYLQSGFPKNMSKFEVWKKAKDLLVVDREGIDADTSKSIQMGIAKLLGTKPIELEELKDLIVRDRIPRSVLLNRGSYPGIWWVLLSPYSGGPKVTKMMVNYMILIFGGVPFMSERFTQTLVEGDIELRRSDRAQYMQMLRTCLNTYANPAETMESIHEGPCGMRQAMGKASILLEYGPYSP